MNRFVVLGLVSGIGLAGCSGGSSSSATGQLTLGLTDGPVEEASAVVISVESVQLHGAENVTVEFDPAKEINLLELQGAERVTLLDDMELAAGEYQWIRLGIDENASYIQIAENGPQYPLVIPSENKSGLKLNRGFTIGAGSTSDFTLDFDLKKSVHEDNGGYKLRPTIRMVSTLETGHITGTVDELLVQDVGCDNGDNDDIGNAVYVFSGESAQLQDIQDTILDPLTTAIVAENVDTGQYEFSIGYLPVGDYTLAFTCDARLDDPSDDDLASMVFDPSIEVSVTAGDTSEVTFDSNL